MIVDLPLTEKYYFFSAKCEMKTDRLLNRIETKMSANKQDLNSYTSSFWRFFTEDRENHIKEIMFKKWRLKKISGVT